MEHAGFLFSVCFFGGCLCNGMALVDDPNRFAVIYTFGNILALVGGFFIMGFCSQLKMMFKTTRAIATTIYIVMMIVTIVVAVTHAHIIVVLICAFIQFLAMGWYYLSYVPFGRTLCKNCAGSFCSV
ncbi:MAG: putative vesicle transport protein SFT2A isoform X2 [Hyperionvirus sp.]|uniref:Putative vesicle transport protein SFT2A isoform X2 n=1 Tax=Hyperionvirus sp. TaxID=2487770 RepID=A0A3G5AES8_9VIRU|nr:MAG: putative vesicle transport protein SFT2A isoform X2 [Hyperionvirus sp.]